MEPELAGSPSKFGRCVPFHSVPPDWLTWMGKPDWSVKKPLSSQPPMMPSTTRLTPEP